METQELLLRIIERLDKIDAKIDYLAERAGFEMPSMDFTIGTSEERKEVEDI